jgi:predicted AlkP superfamily phosphohydrolase/phosphomutase
MKHTPLWLRALISAAFLVVLQFVPASSSDGTMLAYAGPGAGFAFLGSFLTVLIGIWGTMVSLIVWPVRLAWRSITGKRGFRNARVKKVIFLGLDGFDYGLARRFIEEAKLPNLSRLKETGSFRSLRTTFPALSPVAWSTFATGVNPARHNMFDFLNRSLKSYLPELSSAKVHPPRRILKIGKITIPLSRPTVEMRRKSRTFWSILGEHLIPSTILRVPITFPPEKFNGRLLSAMCTPDLLGSQGTFCYFSSSERGSDCEGGVRRILTRNGTGWRGVIEGPVDGLGDEKRSLTLPFTIEPLAANTSRLKIDGQAIDLRVGVFSEWVTLTFKAGLATKVKGICRLLLREQGDDCSLYVSPINIDPENPALPISHPAYYAKYLAKLIGAYCTLGMAEDTWALNEGVLNEDRFLEQAYLTYAEREAMFFSALDRTRKGAVACVFDTTDRIQHMFYRFIDGSFQPEEAISRHSLVIEDLYRRMDDLVGRVMKYVDEDTVLFVLSDHGFASFRRGVNLNAWLLQNGYLAMKEGASPGEAFFKGVDWSRTKAYTFGLGGLYLNIKGREAHGIVEPGKDAESLKRELATRLSGLCDEELNAVSINYAKPTNSVYTGPYLQAAPDLLIAYNDGYRASWDATVGRVTEHVFENNDKAWSGDHCVDPDLVPGVLFCNRRIQSENPGIEDMAPTALHLFGVQPPPYMEGKLLFA